MAGARKITVEFLGDDKSLSKTARDVEGSTSRLGTRLKSVGKVAALGLAGGAVIAGKALWDMGKAAAQDEQSTVQLANALQRSAHATKGQIAQTEDWITSIGKNYGIVDDKLRPALASLARATGDVGKAQKLAGVAMNVSAGTGQDLEAVSKRLAKAYTTGNVRALAAYGVAVKNADGSTKSFAQVQGELSQKFSGSASKAANTFSGKMNRLRVMFDEAKESIGYKLLPVAEKLASWFFNEGLPAIRKFVEYMQTRFGPVFENIRKAVVKTVAQWVGVFRQNLPAIIEIFQGFVSIVQSIWSRFGATILTYVRNTWNNIKTVIGGALNVIAGIVKVFSSLLRGDWSGVWAGIKQTMSGAWEVIKGIARQGINIVRAVISAGLNAIKAVASGVWSSLRSGVNNTIGYFGNLLMPIKNVSKWLSEKLVSAVKTFVNSVAGIGGAIAAPFRTLYGLLKSIADKIQWILDHAPSVPSLKKIVVGNGGGTFKGNVTLPPPSGKKVPAYAQGGVVRARPGGTVALLAEAGHDEAVVPLSGPYAPRARAGGGDFSVTAPLIIQMDSKNVWQGLLQMKRTNGIVELGLA